MGKETKDKIQPLQGGKGKAAKKSGLAGVSTEAMKKEGRNLARTAYMTKGK